MNGPQHYAEAERLLDGAEKAGMAGALEVTSTLTAAAQVHATLALAAATIDAATTVAGEHRDGAWVRPSMADVWDGALG